MKFKLTEFGTLEIISTVETDKGEYEWSTQTEQHTETFGNTKENESVPDDAALKSEGK